MRCCFFVAVLALLPLAAAYARGEEAPPDEAEGHGPATVLFHGIELFRLAPLITQDPETDEITHVVTGEFRADNSLRRIRRIADSPLVNTNDFEVVRHNLDVHAVTHAGLPLVVIWPEDADLAGVASGDLTELAEEWRDRLRDTIDRYRKDYTTDNYLRGALFAGIATLALLVVWLILCLVFRREIRLVEKKFAGRQMLKFLDGDNIVTLNMTLVKLARTVVGIVVLIFYLNVVLSFFPWTFNLSARLFELISTPFVNFGRAFMDHLPKTFTLIVIIGVAWFTLRAVKYIFAQIAEGKVRVRGFYRDWADTTYGLVRTVVVIFALVAAYPYIPGGGSDAFKGISIFVGVLFSLGSTSAVGNFFGGLMLTYMRSFTPGDFVEINGKKGTVMARRTFSTRLKTPTNEIISIPNSAVSSNEIINYSQMTKSVGVSISTTVTISYEVPWRRVHELLLESTKKVPDVMEVPAPRVQQRGLEDFYVTYRLLVATKNPERMNNTLSMIHQNIQDNFANAGVEIMSPHYQANRAGLEVAIPAPESADEEK